MKNHMRTSLLAGCCLATLAAVNTTTASPPPCPYDSNEIIGGSLCGSDESSNEFCHVKNLAPVQGTDRVIWDGSFSSRSSACDGPGGRWTGTTAQIDEWKTISRYVDSRNGDGELVLTAAGGPVTARVFGQTFGEAAALFSPAASTDVFVRSTSFIRVKFTASIQNQSDDGQDAWFRFRLGVKDQDGTYDNLSEYVDGAGQGDLWNIVVQAEEPCFMDFPLDQIGCQNINIRDWLPMIQFGVAGGGSGSSPVLRVDDIEVNIIQISSGDSTNLEPSSVNLNEPSSWTLIARSHWEGGGPDNTEPLADTQEPCLGDTNWDGNVDVEDLINVIGGWGAAYGPGDIDCDGNTDVSDLVTVLGAWGGCQ